MKLIPFANDNKIIEIKGMIDSFPVKKEWKTQLYVSVSAIKTAESNNQWIDISKSNERMLIQKRGLYDFKYGEGVKVWGKIERPGSWDKFSYDRYLEREGVYSLIKNAQVKTFEISNHSLWEEFWVEIFAFRQQFEDSIRHKLTFPENEYALGIILGAESGIPSHIIDDFNETGLRHLLALSGMNITILIVFISWIFFFLPTWIRISLTSLVIFLFVGLTGGSSSVVRAAVMGVIGLIALYAGRKMQPLHIILFALFCMTLWNPFLLVADISLQFSVLAVLGLLYIVPLFEKTFSFLSFISKDLLLVLYATLSAQIAVLPLMLVFFEQVSLVAPLTNLIIVPINTLSMFFGFMVSIPFVGWIAMPFAYALLHFSLWVAKTFADIPYSSIHTSGFPIWNIIPFYFLVILSVILWTKLLSKKIKK